MAENHVVVETVSKEEIDLLMEYGIVDVFPRLDKVPKTIGTKFLEMIHCYLRAIKKSSTLETVERFNRLGKVFNDQGKLVCFFKNSIDAKKEAAVYLLDHPLTSHRSTSSDLIGFGGATPTVFIQTKETSGSLVLVVDESHDVGSYNPLQFKTLPQEIHKLCIFHIRFGSADCHDRNTVSKIDEKGIHRLTPIDHEECFVSNYEIRRVWWEDRNEANEAFTQEVVNYVNKLDVDGDITFLKDCGWDVPSEITVPFKIFTHFLKIAVQLRLTGNEMVAIAGNRHKSDVEFNLVNMVPNDKKQGDGVFLQNPRKKLEACLREYARKKEKKSTYKIPVRR